MQGKGIKTKLALLVSLAVLGAIAPAGGASAATFCVGKPSCSGMNFSTLAQAVNAANAGADRDRIEIAAGQFTGGQSTTQPVDIVGAGTSATAIQNGPAGGTVFNLGANSTISSLTASLDADDAIGLQLAVNDSATGVAVTADSAAAADAGGETGINFGAANVVLNDSSVSMPTAASSATIGVVSAGGTVSNARVDAASGIMQAGAVRRVAVVAGQAGIATTGGLGFSGSIDQATIRMTAAGAAIGTSGFFGGTLVASHVTARGNGSGTGALANAGCNPITNDPLPASLTLRNSILRDFSTDRTRGGASCGGGAANATIETTHSIFDPAKTASTGPGGFTENGSSIAANSLGATNLNVDPLFAGATDLHIQAGSPAVDAGDPAALAGDESSVDLDGNPRVADGDGNGTARRDIGAYERAVPDADGDGVPDPSDACPSVAALTADGCPSSGGGDTTPPQITLGGSAKQKADGTIEVEATCDEDCTLGGDGTVKVKGKKGKRSARAKAKTYGLGEDSASATAGEEVVLELKVPKKAGKAIAKALKKKGKASAALTVTATDGAGNESSDDRSVKLKPKKK